MGTDRTLTIIGRVFMVVSKHSAPSRGRHAHCLSYLLCFKLPGNQSQLRLLLVDGS